MNLNWIYKKIGDVCTVERGGSPRPIDKYITEDENGINWIKIGDTADSMYITSTAQKIIPEGMKKSRYVQPGDFLLSNSMSFGRPYILKIDGCIHDGWLVLRDNNNLFDKRFLYYYLSSPTTYQKFKSLAVGGVVNNLNSNMVRDVEIPIPSIEEQRNISDILDKIKTLIDNRKQQLQKLDELVKSRFIELFGTVKNNHQEYPVIKISGCAKLQGGFAFKSSDYLDNGIRLVQISNVNKDTLDWDSINCVPQTFLQKYKDFELHVGDLVLAMTRPVIKSLDAVKIATVSENDVPSLLNQRVGRFIIDITKINSTYLMLCCQMTEFREYVEAMSGNSLQPNISSKQVEDYSIVLPPLELQEQFAAFVEQTDKSKLAVQQSLDKLETLKKSLMQKYFG